MQRKRGARSSERVVGRVHGLAPGHSWKTLAVVTTIVVVFSWVWGARGARAEATTNGRRHADAEWFPRDQSSPAMMVYPPAGPGRHPVVVMLHGMCGAPENECPFFANAFADKAWLVCPKAQLACPSGGSTWSYSGRSEVVEATIARVVAEHPGKVDADTDRTLIGFSLGAFVAMDLANHAPTRWSRVLLIGAKVIPDTRALARGSTTFVLGAGDLDLSRAHMASAARRMRAAGVTASFLSLGRVGHRFAEDMDEWLDRALPPEG